MRSTWIRRMWLLSLFVLLDYLATLFVISCPGQEANVLARGFMEKFGVASGLTLFSILVNLPIYLILGILAFCPQRLSITGSPFASFGLDIVFAWFVAGTHFSGAISWISTGPGLLYQLFGAALYLFMLFVAGKKLG